MKAKTIIYLIPFLLYISCKEKRTIDNSKSIELTKEQFKFSGDTTNDIFNKYNFTMTRTHYSDSTFTDSPLICSSDTAKICSLTFKRKNGFWYVKTNNEWQEFYNPKENLLMLVYFKEQKFTLKPIGTNLEYNKKTLLGFIKDDLYVYTCDNSNLYFDPDFGVVAIDGNETLVREDYKNRNE